ncbi:MAG: LuxR C-terminal-related transcriptional regulator [Pseudomonadota bacterium]
MTLEEKTADLVNALDTAADVKTACAAFDRQLTDWGYAGFDAFALDMAAKNPLLADDTFFVASYETALIRAYVREGKLATCPAMAALGHAITPFDYVAFLKEHRAEGSAAWQLRFLWLFGVRRAWLIPVSSMAALRGVTCYMTRQGPDAERIFARTRGPLNVAAIHLVAALDRLKAGVPVDPSSLVTDPASLSPREKACMTELQRGLTNAGIAAALDISENTVRFHLKNAYRKLGVHSRTEAMAQATHVADLTRLTIR